MEKFLALKLDDFIGLMKSLEDSDFQFVSLFVDTVREEIEAFLMKRKNIFNVLLIDHNDKGKLSSFNKHFFVT